LVQAANFIMGAKKLDVQTVRGIQENEAPMQPRPALESVSPQFTDAEAAVEMRLAEFLAEATERKPASLFLQFRQNGDFCLDGGQNDERFFHAIVRG